jgi:hypothetical protein
MIKSTSIVAHFDDHMGMLEFCCLQYLIEGVEEFARSHMTPTLGKGQLHVVSGTARVERNNDNKNSLILLVI